LRRLPEYLANQALKLAIPQGKLGIGQLSTLCNCGGKALSQVHNKKPIFGALPKSIPACRHLMFFSNQKFQKSSADENKDEKKSNKPLDKCRKNGPKYWIETKKFECAVMTGNRRILALG
jgi:hypothetical protein